MCKSCTIVDKTVHSWRNELLKENISEERQLEEITNTLKEADLKMDDPFVPNTKFMELMEISTRTAQVWRDEEKIGYSQIAGKIYYRKSDIEKLLNDNYHKAKEKGGNKRW